MLTFTELKDKKVYTEDGVLVGSLADMVFDFEKIAKVTKFFVKSPKLGTKELFIPGRYLLKINRDISIAKNYTTDKLEENELFVQKNLIDKQIIDLEGRKVVRVNDVLFSKKRNFLVIAGVETGILGILRWVGLEGQVKAFFKLFGKHIMPSVLPWSNIQPLELSEGKVVLNINQEKLENIHPEDLADYLEATNMDNVIRTINLLDPDFAADVIAELNLDYQVQLCREIGVANSTRIISLMDPDEAVDLLVEFSEVRRADVLEAMDQKKARELLRLMRFVDTEVGDFLTTEFLTVGTDDNAKSVILKIKKEGRDISFLDYVYVANTKGQLLGVFNLHQLILQHPNTPVRRFMHDNAIVLHIHTPLAVVQRRLIKYKLTALPVVDRFRKIQGIVTFDDVGEYFLDKAIEPEVE